MFRINEDKSIYVTRGDYVSFSVTATDAGGAEHTFSVGDVLRFKVFEEKACEEAVLVKDFPVTEAGTSVNVFLSGGETKLGEYISKPKNYWYEVELNPDGNTQTIIGYDEDGAKIFRLFPEGGDGVEGALE